MRKIVNVVNCWLGLALDLVNSMLLNIGTSRIRSMVSVLGRFYGLVLS